MADEMKGRAVGFSLKAGDILLATAHTPGQFRLTEVERFPLPHNVVQQAVLASAFIPGFGKVRVVCLLTFYDFVNV
ncbi:MAG: hypothetical protein Q4C73_00220 [Eubacteriales bacterium]|nr:hypothetical protein [Eubacteriales bacterium]